jgi:hypothetical protein
MRVAFAAAAAVLGAAALGAPSDARAQVIAGWNVSAQWDRGGDYRCDAYWDANRTDCGAAWRAPRRGYDRHDGGVRRGYGHAQASGEAWHGAYGRPDLVYPSGGGHAARDGRRMAWCRANYRSYDPHTGFYRAYSGRWVYCG